MAWRGNCFPPHLIDNGIYSGYATCDVVRLLAFGQRRGVSLPLSRGGGWSVSPDVIIWSCVSVPDFLVSKDLLVSSRGSDGFTNHVCSWFFVLFGLTSKQHLSRARCGELALMQGACNSSPLARLQHYPLLPQRRSMEASAVWKEGKSNQSNEIGV